MNKLTDKIKNPTLFQRKDTPVWKGPEQDGITFSQLSRFLCCRERFRLLVVEGLKPKPKFNASIEYGSLWHCGEEALAANKGWKDAGLNYARNLSTKYPFDREEIDHWLQKFYMQFPAYIEYWQEHEDVKERIPLLQEQVFDIPYKLPSGRTVRLRGKWDSVDLIGKGKDAGIYLQENKTKSQIDNQKITRQLTNDLQSMIYVIALQWHLQNPLFGYKEKLKGVRYNVIRRSAHKTAESMYKKMSEDIADGRGGEWFSRWNVEISENDIEEFKKRTLNPILEQLCDWWDWIKLAMKDGHDVFLKPVHWQYPFGVYNVILEGGSSELDSYIATGSDIGLERVSNLFPELE